MLSDSQIAQLNDSFKTKAEAVKNKRSSYHPYIKGLFEIAKSHGIYWLTAKEVADKLHAIGVIDHANPRSIGDTLGNHEGGMNLEKRRVAGKMQYRMFKENQQ